MDKVECLVIGAGAVGLAVAAELARDYEVILVEKNEVIGSGISSRNSEVIHAGLHYPKGSLKAHFCIDGQRLLYDYCSERGIFAERCGKLIVGYDHSAEEALKAIKLRAEQCGVSGLQLLNEHQLRRLEPALEAKSALLSPNTGIFDSHHFMLSLQGDFENRGGVIAYKNEVEAIDYLDGSMSIRFKNDSYSRIRADIVINAAGLGAVAVAANSVMIAENAVPKLFYAKGNYFSTSVRSPFSRLIYPLPNDEGLGVHLTFDRQGRVKFGPDVEWIDELSFTVDPARAVLFYQEIRKFWPSFEGELSPDYAGIRPKIIGPRCGSADFRIDDQSVHGVPGLINLFGIESPGLTSSLAIGRYVRKKITETKANVN